MVTVSGREEAPEIVRWYTRARKFPQLIGKTPDGAKLWGGPYTYTQVIGAAVVLVVGLKTISLWGAFGLIGNALVVLGAAYGTALLLGRLPIGSRSPISVGAGVVRALSGPAQGILCGAPLRIRRPHRVRSRLVIRHPIPSSAHPSDPTLLVPADPVPAEVVQSEVSPAREPALQRIPSPAEPGPTTHRRPALTGVQRLLASTGANSQEELGL